MTDDVTASISRVAGLMKAILRMLEDGKPRTEIAQQIRAAYGALRKAELRFIQADIEELIARKATAKEVAELVDRIFKFAK